MQQKILHENSYTVTAYTEISIVEMHTLIMSTKMQICLISHIATIAHILYIV